MIRYIVKEVNWRKRSHVISKWRLNNGSECKRMRESQVEGLMTDKCLRRQTYIQLGRQTDTQEKGTETSKSIALYGPYNNSQLVKLFNDFLLHFHEVICKPRWFSFTCFCVFFFIHQSSTRKSKSSTTDLTFANWFQRNCP